MAEKSTDELLKELSGSETFKKYKEENTDSYVKAQLSDMLNGIIEEKGLKKTDVIRRAEISEIYGFQIFGGKKIPERGKLLCLLISMGLEFAEIQDVLKKAGYSPLYVRIPFDCVIIYCICKNKSVAEINEMLYDYGFETL